MAKKTSDPPEMTSKSCSTNATCRDKMKKWAIIGIVIMITGVVLWVVSSILSVSTAYSPWGFYGDPGAYVGSALAAYYMSIVGHILFWSGLALTAIALARKYFL